MAIDDKPWQVYLMAALISLGTSATGVYSFGPVIRNDPCAISDRVITMGVRIDRLEKRMDAEIEDLQNLSPRSTLESIAELKAEILVLKNEQKNLESLIVR